MSIFKNPYPPKVTIPKKLFKFTSQSLSAAIQVFKSKMQTRAIYVDFNSKGLSPLQLKSLTSQSQKAD